MTGQIKSCVVRVFGAGADRVVGAGFLIDDRHVLTCGHVLDDALDLQDGEDPTGRFTIELDFPFLAAGHMYQARVESWKPTVAGGPRTSRRAEDVALLRLRQEPPPGYRPASLVEAEDLWGHTFRAFGFPAGYDTGVWASGVVRAEQTGGWLQIEDSKDTGYFVAPGFSGTPVWDEQMDSIVGMVVAADSQAQRRAAFILPAHVFTKAYPDLEQTIVPPCPYRGLYAFREQDSPCFCGREEISSELHAAVRNEPLVAVIGPSGSGKSSLVFAGLIPGLRRDGTCLIASFRPGAFPFRALGECLLPLLEPEMTETARLIELNDLATALERGAIGLQELADRIVRKHSGADQLLLVIDQFEELFALCPSATLRKRFLDTFIATGQRSTRYGSAVKVVLTLRADFVGAALSYRPLADALQHADVKLGPMTREEMRRAIEEPARRYRVTLEEGLTERILHDVGGRPGDLPLLEFALTLLWSRQRRGRMTHAAYDEIGGVEHALTNHADEVFGILSGEEQRRTQKIFLQLVQPGDKTEDSRRVATREEIGDENWDLVGHLADARLVVCGRHAADSGGRETDTVEVVHEALISGWDRLRKWLDLDRGFRTWQERMRTALRQWDATAHDEGALLRGALLREAVDWLGRREADLTPEERAFVRASIELERREVERAAQLTAIRREREAAVAILSRPEARRIVSAMTLAVIVSTITLVFLKNLLPFARMDLGAYDFYFQGRGQAAATEIALVGIDQPSIDGLAAPDGTIPRHYMAQAIDALHRAHALAIGFLCACDQPAPSSPDDAALTRAIRTAGDVVLQEHMPGNAASSQVQNYAQLIRPLPRFVDAAAGIGMINFPEDEDGKVRAADLMQKGPGGIGFAGEVYPSFEAELAHVALHRPVTDIVRGLPQADMLIHYLGRQDPGDASNWTFSTSQFKPLATNVYSTSELRRLYGNKIVLIIPATLGNGNEFSTPFGPMFTGVVQANVLSTILARNPIWPVGGSADGMIALVLALICAVAVSGSRIWIGGGIAALLAAGFAFLTALEFDVFDVWIPIVAPETALGLTFTAIVAWRYTTQERQRRHIRAIFAGTASHGSLTS